MSSDAKTIENLTELYMSQSPAAFTSIAMHAKEPNDYSKRVDGAEHGGTPECTYGCCNEKGCCASGWWYVGCVVGIVCCCMCCCYITNGFYGAWTYWPF
ncbi:hypothetical protein Mpt1_c03420 [Candidatus Methanoplasma termitum]|uniref:Uncharacterized protein n=1 Tax=Candidatus Methanoplasma termitum TaxID=1577791 RepID=A0A0A7LB59_9ARCH|nr:hypothetical protein [Candidatus Methanoplasma termitum]AIZ56238.1 hypothetical protein Mpt1_c03420 [Candidatus Methanoplasma termitum]MCL2333660.1 hypothetical protein [Candidatus Methanoplasma sp.]